MSTLRVDTIQDRVGTGQPDIDGVAKAWVNFNGTGTVAIRASFNVTSITDNGTGTYTVNFTNAMPDDNYAIFQSIKRIVDWGEQATPNGTHSTTSFPFIVRDEAGTAYDVATAYAAVFR